MDVWITGANGGIGKSCCDYLSHHRLLTNDGDVQDKINLINLLGGFQPEVLVYCAGRNYLDWSYKISTIEFNWIYDTNVTGLIRCIQVAPTLSKVVVIGSDAARRPMRTSVAYNASKAAVEAAVKVIARERAHEGFVINCVSPGLIEGTAMTDYVIERTKELRPELDIEEYMLSGIPAGRPGEPSDVARVVKWLVDEAPDYLNGSIIELNGGR